VGVSLKTLEELKAAWDAALDALKAKPEDEALKTAAADAEAAYNAKKAEPPPGEEDDSAWDDKTKAYIKKLRDESASHRTKNKELTSVVKTEKERTKAILKAAGIEDDSEKPEEKIKSLSAESQTLAFRNAILESAVHNGIPADQLEFYEFLVAKEASKLAEGEELSEATMTEIVAKIKKTGSTPASSSVGTGKGGGTPPPGNSGAVSLDAFCAMSITQKSDLYVKNPNLYTQLLAEAKAKKRLV
jgi:hypothetical protein